MLTRFAVAVVWILHFLPLALLAPIGSALGSLLYILGRERLAEAQELLHGYLGRAPVRTGYPKPALVHEWLGRSFEAQGDTESAKREYQSALQADPRNKWTRDALKRLEKK